MTDWDAQTLECKEFKNGKSTVLDPLKCRQDPKGKFEKYEELCIRLHKHQKWLSDLIL